jgi:Uma2 family endonuclease
MTVSLWDPPPCPWDPPPDGGWTTDHLDAFPEDNVRRELVDGVLYVPPSRTTVHQIIAARLMVAFDDGCPDDVHVTQAVEVRLSARRSFIPDGLVVTRESARPDARFYAPHDVVLAVEVESPTTETMDRIVKPALYAEVGIPYFWRVETNPSITVNTFRLDGVYRPAGTYTDVIETDEPWAISVPIARLTPRHF